MAIDFVGYLRRQQFNPGLLGLFVNPFFLARRALWRDIASLSNAVNGRMLDVGCGRKPYRKLFSAPEYVGLEIDSPEARAQGHADFYYDGNRFPFADGSFDAVLCNQVLEHVFKPVEFLQEIARVLRPGGKLLLTVPFVWDEHEQPRDYARYSSFGLAFLLRENGFKVETQKKTLADFSILMQLTNAYLFKISKTRFRILNLLITAVLMAPISVLGLILGGLFPRNNDLFLDSVVVAERAS